MKKDQTPTVSGSYCRLGGNSAMFALWPQRDVAAYTPQEPSKTQTTLIDSKGKRDSVAV